jgi:hypothetical protein
MNLIKLLILFYPSYPDYPKQFYHIKSRNSSYLSLQESVCPLQAGDCYNWDLLYPQVNAKMTNPKKAMA